METLESVFPAVPVPALQRVLEICDGNVETASEWILENNWRDLLDNDAAEDAAGADEEGDHNAQTQDRAGRGEASERAATGSDEASVEHSHVREQTHSASASALQSAATASSNAPVAASSGSEANRGLTISGDSTASRIGSGDLSFAHASSANASRQHQHHDHFGGSASTGVAAAAAAPAPALVGRALGRHDDRDFESGGEHDGESDDYEEDEDEDDEDDDDDDDDDDDAHSYYDSGDDAFYHGSGGAGGVLPLAKRVKVTADSDAVAAARDPKQEMYWVAFDGQVVRKTLIELLNTTLSKLAHSKVTLLNKSTKHIEELEAKEKLVSVLEVAEESDTSTGATESVPAVSSASRSGIDHILNDADAKSVPAAVAAASTRAAVDTKVSPPSSSAAANGQKRKRSTDESVESPRAPLGFFAHFFSVSDLDMIWRSVMHAHLFNARFGEMIEFHTASCGAFNKRDFDELMHIQTNMASSRAASLGLSPAAALKCCLILPCTATESEIFRVGKHLHSLLKLQGSLYYRTLDDPAVVPQLPPQASSTAASSTSGGTLPAMSSTVGSSRSTRMDLLNEDGKMTEDSFRRFARHRIKKEEQEAAESKEAHALVPDHFLAYQQQRKVEYCLQALEADGWDRRLSS